MQDFLEVSPGFEPGNNGFADRGLTAWLWHRILFAFQPVYYNRHFFVCQGFFAFSFLYLYIISKLLMKSRLARWNPSNTRMKSASQMKSNPSPLPTKSDFITKWFHPTYVGFIPFVRTDLVDKKNHFFRSGFLFWSGLRGSNPPPQPWQGCALPNELNPHMVPPVGIEPTTRGFSVPCSTNWATEAYSKGCIIKVAIRMGVEPTTSSVTG